jgi:hypothetical protein
VSVTPARRPAEEYSFETPILTLQLQGTFALNVGHRGGLKVQIRPLGVEAGERRPEQAAQASRALAPNDRHPDRPQIPDSPAAFLESGRGHAPSPTIKNGRGGFGPALFPDC